MNCLKLNLLFLIVLLFFPCSAFAAIDIDGRLNEPEWANAQRFKDFAVVDPFTLEKPGLSTEALVLSTPDGLAVAFICEQPGDENQTRTKTQRDATDFDADSVSLMIDFDGSRQIAYEFSVSISDSYRDGTIIQENQANYEWDGMWKHAVNEEQDRWTVEIVLPWSIVSMRENSGDKQEMGVCFQRTMQASNEIYSIPAASLSRPQFISEFEGIEVAKYSSQELIITPYSTALGDLLNNTLTGKVGLDLSWKPSGRLNVIATVNPDFGTVESDDLVINFSATETRYTDKRPFFIENQRIFDTPDNEDKIFYTRRIGGANDKDGKASDIAAALKIIGSTRTINYGVFAAKEADDAGRSFYAGQVVFPADNWDIGLLSTYVERPFLDRTALVSSLNYNANLSDTLKMKGTLMGSRIQTHGDNSHGFGLWDEFRYASIDDRWSSTVTINHFNDTLDLNDMGYLDRNGYEEFFIKVAYNQKNFSDDSRTALASWDLSTGYKRNTNGDRLPDTLVSFGRNAKLRSGSQLNGGVTVTSSGYDDRLSRNNGLVWLDERLAGSIMYITPRRGKWSKSILFLREQEGVEGWTTMVMSDFTWYPNEGLNIDFSLRPSWSGDWLKWVQGKQLGSFSKEQITGTIAANWFPSEGHEIRLKTQWYTINAKAKQSYTIGDNSRLIEDNAPINDFTANSFALQLRYRYEIAPMSYLYICYSRGGNDYLENSDKSTLGLLGDTTDLRDSDQILVKLSYRLKVF